MNLPYTTECGHTFCYLCLKTQYELTRECPKCKVALSERVHEKANMPLDVKVPVINGPVWLYHGRVSGWWRYDPISNKKIEEGYVKYVKANQPPESEMIQISDSEENAVTMNIRIMGRDYTINFETMTQNPDPLFGSTRDICRIEGNNPNLTIKGIAGLQIRSSEPTLVDVEKKTCCDNTQ